MNETNLFLDLEKKGLAALNQEKYQEAVFFFEKIIRLSPNYEHGMAFYHLACALEEIGEIASAKNAYEKALFFAPEDRIRMGGYASFLYLYGNAKEAFNAYLDLLKMYNQENDINRIYSCNQALYSLGAKIGWKSEEVSNKIENCLFGNKS